jgi:large subunit ribosomal protein L25
MSNIAIKAEKRNNDELKKNAARRLRASGYVPGTIYGQAQEPVNIKVNRQEFKEIIKGKSIGNLILDMHVKADGKEKKEIALIKEIQQHPISLDYLHIDFIRIEMKTEVEALVHVSILNEEESVGVKDEEGVVQHGVRELHILSLPSEIPEKIVIDIKDLHMGHHIKVSDLVLKDSIKVLNNPDEVIVSIIHGTYAIVEPVAAVIEEEEVDEPALVTGKKVFEKEGQSS